MCVYVCVYVCMVVYVNSSAYLCVYMCVWSNISAYVCMCVFVGGCTCDYDMAHSAAVMTCLIRTDRYLDRWMDTHISMWRWVHIERDVDRFLQMRIWFIHGWYTVRWTDR